MAKVLFIDFETRSTLDLPDVGVHVYADPKATEVLLFAWAFDDGPIQCTSPRWPDNLVLEHVKSGGLVVCHNAAFEYSIWNNIFCPSVPLKISQLRCTMAMAYALSIPATLESAAAVLGVEAQKDQEGKKLMLSMARPQSIAANGDITWKEDPESIARLKIYCVQDVEVERQIFKRMPTLSDFEQKVWELDQTINNRGICVDRDAVKNALQIVEDEKLILDEKMVELTNGYVKSCREIGKIKSYCEFFDVESDSFSKADIIRLCENSGLNPHIRELLNLRLQSAKAATSKLKPMDLSANDDNRIRGCFQYSGASTRRWSGRRVQLQNLKRPSRTASEMDLILNDLHRGVDRDFVDTVYGDPMEVISDCTRGFLTAAPKHRLRVCDFSAIEARVLAWLAGEESVLEIFRNNEDIYLTLASSIFGVKITDKKDPRRQVGKVAMLALGYAGGVGAFQTMAKAYGVQMAPALSQLWNAATTDIRDQALWRYEQAGKDFDISKEEFLASEIVKLKWRLANPNIVKYWAEAEECMTEAIQDANKSHVFGPQNRGVTFYQDGSFLLARLPSNGIISYPYPELKIVKNGKNTKYAPSFMAQDLNKKWVRETTYSGKIVENLTQSVARDLLAEALLRLESRGYTVVGHVHDEIICEMPIGKGSAKEMAEIMAESPVWAKGLPTPAEGHESFRYGK